MSISVSVNRSNNDAAATRVAPLGVVFDATATTDASTSQPFCDLVFYWIFGDGAATFSYGRSSGISKNIAFGPVAAHVYKTPGTYTPKLAVYNGDVWTWETLDSITVTDPDTIFSGTDTVVISTAGDFTGKPTGATEVTSSDFDADVISRIATGKRVLLRKGETFTSSAFGGLSSAISVSVLGAFGTGAKPIVTASAAHHMLRFANASISDVRIQDIKWTGNDGASPIKTSGAGITVGKVTVTDCTFTGVAQTIGTSGTDVYDDIIMQDCDGTQIGTTFIRMRRFGIMGNSLDDSTNGTGEHVFRVQYGNVGVIQANYFANQASTKYPLTIRGVPFAGTGEAILPAESYTERMVVADNKVQAGTEATAVVQIGASADSEDHRFKNVLLERNWLIGATGVTVPQMAVHVRTSTPGPVCVRNNILDMSDHALARNGIVVQAPDAVHGTDTENVWVYGNGYIDRTGTGNARVIWFQSADVANGIAKNNLGFAVDSATEIMVADSGTGTTASNNSSDAQLIATCPYTDTTPTDPNAGEFTPTGYALTGGDTSVKNYLDFFGNLRGNLAEMGPVALTTDDLPEAPADSSPGLMHQLHAHALSGGLM